ncbi:MAG: hypothetical protein ACJZ8A_05360 [Paracoccaceae bacterium]
MYARLIIISCCFFMVASVSHAAGVYYDGTAQTHCTEWSNKRLKWPQTILGKFTAKCRIRAKRLSKGPVVCRLKRDYINSETGERMCVYQRGGFNLGDATVSMPKTEKCLKTYSCKRE